MKLKPITLLVSLAALSLVFAGCSPAKETAEKAPTPAVSEPEKSAGDPAEAKTDSEKKPDSKLASYDAARAEAKKDGKLLMLKFEADWCGPCKDMSEAMKSDIVLAEEMKNYTVLHVDIDDPKNKDIAARFYPDSGIPFVIILRPQDESRVTDFLGFDTAPTLARELKAARDKA